MSIALRATQTASSTTSTQFAPVIVPTGAVLGDILIASINATSATAAFTPPSGWTQVATKANTTNATSVTVFWKECVLGDPGSAPTFAMTPGARVASSVRAYSGVDVTTPMDVAAVTANGSSAAPTAPSITPANTNDEIVAIFGCNIPAANPAVVPVWTAPTNYGNPVPIQTTATSGNTNTYQNSYDRSVSTTTATGTLVAALDASHSWAAVTLALRSGTLTNLPPVVSAGVDQSVNGGDIVTLTASGTDPEGGPVTLGWAQLTGPAVTLSGSGGTQTFAAPNTTTTLTFRATGTDNLGASATDDMTVSVTSSSLVVTLRDTATRDGTTASKNPTVTIPTTVRNGDYMLAYITVNTILDMTGPTGWTLVARQANTGNTMTLWVWGKTVNVANDSGASPQWTFTGTVRFFTVLRVYANANFTTPIDGAVLLGTGNNVNPTVATQTPTATGRMHVVGYACSVPVPPTDPAWVLPTSYSQQIEGNTSTTTSGSNSYLSTDERYLTTAAATGSVVSPISVARAWASVGILLVATSGDIPPTADAGADQTVFPYDLVTLNGLGTDPDGTVTLAWAQLSGPSVTFTDNGTGVATFTAPAVRAGTALVFQLTVDDGQIAITDNVTITVYDANEFSTSTTELDFQAKNP